VTDLSGSNGSTAERPSLTEIADVFSRYGNFTSEAEAQRAPLSMDRSLRGVAG
jgi:hypothetical protein